MAKLEEEEAIAHSPQGAAFPFPATYTYIHPLYDIIMCVLWRGFMCMCT